MIDRPNTFIPPRVGLGYDVHRFVKGRKLYLGGVEIPFAYGLEGHSDADVLIHAICDAMLGALGQGDIGEHFPNTDLRYKNIASLKLLEGVAQRVREEGYKVSNIDTVVIAEEPNLKAYKQAMKEKVAGTLGIEAGNVNIKATTNEGMGFAGRKEGMAAYATVMLVLGE